MSSISENISTNETKPVVDKSKTETIDKSIDAYKFLSCLGIVTFKIYKKEFFNQIDQGTFFSTPSIIPITFKKTSAVLDFPFLPEDIFIHTFCVFDSTTGIELSKTYNVFLMTTSEWSSLECNTTVLNINTKNKQIHDELKDILSAPEYENHILQFKIKINYEIDEFVILEIRNLDKSHILVSTDPRTFNISDKTCYLDKFPNKAYLANYSLHHYFTLAMFYKIFTDDIEPQKDGNLTYYNIYTHIPLVFLSKRFQSDFFLKFKESKNFNINFLVKKMTLENFVTYNELSVSHYLSIVFKEQYAIKNIKPLQIYKYIEYTDEKLRLLYSFNRDNNLKKFLNNPFWISYSIDFKNKCKKFIKPKEYIEILNIFQSIRLIRKIKYNPELIDTSISIHFKKYNNTDDLNTVVLHSKTREVDEGNVFDIFDLPDDNTGNEKMKLLIEIINENNGIIYFKSSVPDVKDTFIIYLFSNEKYMIRTEDITNIPLLWQEIIPKKFQNKNPAYNKVLCFFVLLLLINIVLFLVLNLNPFQ